MSHKLSRREERQHPASPPPPSLKSTGQADKVERPASRSDARARHSSVPVGARAKRETLLGCFLFSFFFFESGKPFKLLRHRRLAPFLAFYQPFGCDKMRRRLPLNVNLEVRFCGDGKKKLRKLKEFSQAMLKAVA